MPIPFIVAGAVLALIGTAAVVANWDEIKDWLSAVFSKIKEVFAHIKHAAKIFGQKLWDKIKYITKLYYKQDGKYYEETTTREVTENQVPSWAKEQLDEEETDVTNEMKLNLGI
ncbi:MAG: hypothetical protein K6F69_03680 [Treponema sp.]|nr:hypothetical protein [Treponema sp.]